ncbi:hypothetical protein [Terriglobus sp.]|uniref:hypothetical protein n=1 Tax=Terriglobus sp. TaxID=1889013 RepID=UPI003B002937
MTTQGAPQSITRTAHPRQWALHAVWIVLVTVLAIVLLGYHPFAEDGGIYAAAVEARLNPALFPHDHAWVTAHTRFALFVPAVSTLTRTLHLPLATVLFSLYAAGIAALLAAAAHLARTCFPGEHRPWLATLTVAVGAGLPVAGTALYAVDPYSSARTLTTPLLLFALSFALRQRWSACALCWIAAAAMHPLMALWGALSLLLTAALSTRQPRRWTLALLALPFFAAILLNAASPTESAGAYVVAHTRTYWFPAQWHWYEWIGAVAPCMLLVAFSGRFRRMPHSALSRLALASVATTGIAAAIALSFARETAPSLTVARLQPLRSLHLVFLAFLVASGALLQASLRTASRRLLALTTLAVAAGSVLAMQRSLYPHTPHLEWPGATPVNPWEAAFAWCRTNTSPSALFALDASYINQPEEDSHGFRAIALRSALPDQVKDAGIAAVLPALTPSWQAGVAATRDLNGQTDSQRLERLTPFGVTWIILPTSSATTLPCPFQNRDAKVCQLPSL